MSCLLIGTVTNLALVMEEHRAAHRVAGLALVQPGMARIGSPADLLRAGGEHRVRQANGRHRPFTWAGRLGSRSEATDRWPLVCDRCTSLRRARHFDAADRKAAQLQFAGRNVAGDPMHLSPQFDASVLRADPPRGGRRQYGCLGAGIEEKTDRCAIGENLDHRLVIKHRNLHREWRRRRLGQANGSADAPGRPGSSFAFLGLERVSVASWFGGTFRGSPGIKLWLFAKLELA